MEIRGANAVVTGGSRGIGPYIAKSLLARGAKVTLTARSAGDLELVERSFQSNGHVASVAADVNEAKDRRRIFEAAQESGPVDILVNNAGMEVLGRFPDFTPEDVHRIVTTNLESTIQMTLLAVPGMLERGHGQVVNIASLAGKVPLPYNSVYSATKFGLVGFSLSVRSELRGTGVGVSVVCPGYVVEAGMYARHGEKKKPRAGSWTTPHKVGEAVAKAIERDLAEILVCGVLPRLGDVMLAISPRMTDSIARRTGGYRPIQRNVEAAGKVDSTKTPPGAN
ncbi:MAG: SDR family NAD(P)-dependent oxidoreductase [Actinomycetota bacterium]